MRTRTVLLAALLIAPVGATSHAAQHKCCWGSGAFSGDEYEAINYQQYKSTVENTCNCTGILVKTIPEGQKLEQRYFQYNNTWSTGGVGIGYYVTHSGSLRVFQKSWCHSTNANGYLVQCGPETYWQLPDA
jgi:hypothetical protein